jgi:acetyl-CoA carboxylase biotin carboxylase subunit
VFKKILIANRGEIAVRIAEACRKLGVASVAIYSEADRDALHVRAADEAFECGPARATESYLDVSRIVRIAQQAGVDAVHPGYGFLSENAAFAQAIAAAGIAFIGPTPEVIRAMGLKVAARERMQAAGVPVVPGGEAIEDFEAARSKAAEIGYPVLVKASAGGGGRGMRRVETEAELEEAIARAKSEAGQAFGDEAVYLEKFLRGPRHIEIQVMADAHGHTIHLGERECSVQRRHQKLVEEAPAFGMTPSRRAEMGEAAVRAARAVDYVGAGTCEFLVDAEDHFYFLEMNTRIQVEHPVTECVTGVDLVETQIRVAVGEPLSLRQEDVRIEGHAIEVRVYAEDPDKGFLPSPGRIEVWAPPEGAGIRLDSGFEGGQTISSHYDPMLAKLIVSGADRAQALDRMQQALDAFRIAGIRTGLPFVRRLIRNPVFRKGAYDTSFIEAEMAEPLPPLDGALQKRLFALLALLHARSTGERSILLSLPKEQAFAAEVQETDASGRVEIDGEEHLLEVPKDAAFLFQLDSKEVDGPALPVEVVARKKGGFEVGLPDRFLRVKVTRAE